MQVQSHHLKSIQVLRAFAAILVVMFHAQGHARNWAIENHVQLPSLDSFFSFKDFGAIGVDLFFVISGFIMTFITWKHLGDASYRFDFFKKRFVRLVPTYWFYTLFLIILAYYFPIFAEGRVFDAKKIILSLVFLATGDADGGKSHVISVAWTLVYEIFFYFCVFVSIPFSRKYFLALVSLFFLISFLAVPALIEFLLHRSFAVMKNGSLLMEFIFGILVGSLYRRGYQVTRGTAQLAILASLSMMLVLIVHPLDIPRCFAWGIPVTFLLFGAVYSEKARPISSKWNFLVSLGDSSYSLYLAHVPLIIATAVVYNSLRVGAKSFANADCLFVTMFLLSIASSHLIYVGIEKRLLKCFGTEIS